MKREQTASIVKKVHELYLHQDKFVTAENISARISYWDKYFKEFSYEIVDRAVDLWAKSHYDMPLPANLIPICRDLRDELINAPMDFNSPDFKPPCVRIWEARNGPVEQLDDKPLSPELQRVRDALIESFRKEQQTEVMSGQLPYEI